MLCFCAVHGQLLEALTFMHAFAYNVMDWRTEIKSWKFNLLIYLITPVIYAVPVAILL